MTNEIPEFHKAQSDDSRLSTLAYLQSTLNMYLSQLNDKFIPVIKKTFQLDNSYGTDLEFMASFYNLTRNSGETDQALRRRLIAVIGTTIEGTVGGIQDLFEVITGLRPVIQEDFETRTYGVNEVKETIIGLAQFKLLFNVELTKVQEQLRIRNDGESVVVGHTTNIKTTGSFAAYFPDTDPYHTTDVAVSLDVDTSVLIVSGAPHLPGRKVNVEYEITQDDNPDFDTLEELNDNLESFQSILNIVKPAGIKTSPIEIAKFINALFQKYDPQIVTVIDAFETPGFGNPEFIDSLANADTAIGWGNEGFGVGKFDRVYTPVVDSLVYFKSPELSSRGVGRVVV